MANNSETKGKRPSEQFMDEVAAAYGTKYDDRDLEGAKGRPYLRELAQEFKTSTVRIRKILITRGLYSTEVTREVERLCAAGYKVPEICEIMNRTLGSDPNVVKFVSNLRSEIGSVTDFVVNHDRLSN